ncbi:hypothetical protein GCM10028783_31660 [Modestobacter muralis]
MDLGGSGQRLRGGVAQRFGDAAVRGPVRTPSADACPPYLSAVRGTPAATDTEESRVHQLASPRTRPAMDGVAVAPSALHAPVRTGAL